jgi:anti-sigma factor RsiW
MDCRQFQDDMTAYLDDELPSFRSEEVRAHIEACRACFQELRGLEQSALFIDTNYRELEPGRNVWAQVRSRIATFEPSGSPAGFFQLILGHRWLTATAMVGAVAVLAAAIWNYAERQQSEAELRQYMTSYIEARETRDQGPFYTDAKAAPGGRYIDLDYAENPFVTVQSTSYDNPFRSEGR